MSLPASQNFEQYFNVFSNFIPKKLVTFNDKNPPLMSEYLKTKLNDVTKYMHGVSMKIMSAD